MITLKTKLIKGEKYLLDEGTTCQNKVILLEFGRIYGLVTPASPTMYAANRDTWEVMLNRLTRVI